MRSVLPILLSVLIFPPISGCKRQHLLCCEPPFAYPFDGNWRLVEVSGGFAGVDIHVPSDSVTLALNANWQYSKTVKGQRTDSGPFTLVGLPAGAGGHSAGLRFGTDTLTTWLFQLQSDSLLLWQYEVNDGFDYLYKRIPN